MTTVAYDGATIASDSMAVSARKEPLNHKKLFCNIGKYQVIGFCGDFACIAPLIHWLADPDKNSYCDSLTEREFDAICIDESGAAWLYTTGLRYHRK